MSGPDDSDEPPRPPEDAAVDTDDDGWGEAAKAIAPPRAAEPEPDLDDMWGMAPPPPVGQELSPSPPRILSEDPVHPELVERGAARTESKEPSPRGESESVRESGSASDLEPMPDYSAEAERWREELHSAVSGTQPKPAKRDATATSRKHLAPPAPKRRLSARTTRIAIGAGIAVVVIGIVVALGWFNSRDYYLTCATHEIRAERGRAFPPWGTRSMSGAEWTAIKIPDNTECIEHRTGDLAELEGHFLDALLGQANARLASAEPENIDLAEGQLKQAFLLTRTPERRDKRKEVERLVGDVEYWRAAAQVRSAVAELGKAGEQFEGAAKRLPRHQTDSAAWAEYTRHMSDELLRGPPSLRPSDPAADQPGDTPPFKGTGPDSPVRMPDAGVPEAPPVDAQPGIMLPPPSDAAPPPPDAGLPKGGVLL